jgi:hypothetical protein
LVCSDGCPEHPGFGARAQKRRTSVAGALGIPQISITTAAPCKGALSPASMKAKYRALDLATLTGFLLRDRRGKRARY